VPLAPELHALQGAIAGDVVLPGAPAYDAVGRPQIARFRDVRPQAVVLCATPTDVAEAVSVARRARVPIAMRSGGHCFAGRSSTSGIVVDVTPMRAVSVADGVATVGAGARLGDIYDALDERGLTIAAGCGPTVGIAGLTLGGGLGILGRRHGLTSDQLLGAQLVLADGRVVESDEHHEDDLFWALRGAGGGNFGVVTTLVLTTLPAPTATSFHLVWPYAHAASLIEAWQAWAPAAPDELAASLLVTAGGDSDREPVAHLFGAMLGSEDETTALLDEPVVRAGADPTSASLGHGPYREIKRHLAEHGPGEPSEQGHAFSKSEFFGRPLSADAIGALVESFAKQRPTGQSRELDFTPWGGAYNRVPADATAFVHRDARFLLKQTVVVEPDAPRADAQAGRDWLARSWALVHPWGSGRVYQNFPDPDLDDWADAYYGSNRDRLLAVKARYDPDDVFRFPQSLSSTSRARSS
jgi:FAD/FMN-containing dehydrogenase